MKIKRILIEDEISPVVISTWQSIYKQSPQWFNQFNVIFGDEAHLYKAKSLTSIMDKMVNVRYRIGTTGTIDSKLVHKLVLEGIFGPVYKVISTKELMDNSHISNLKIKCLVLNYPDDIRKALKKAIYFDEIEYIVTNQARNKFIANLTLACEGNTLVLFQYVEKHGKVLYEMIKRRVENTRQVFFIHGGTDTLIRESARYLTANETNAIIIASYGTTSTGVNIPSIENIIFASPTKSKIRNLQSIGRGLRLNKGKSYCTLFDIADNLTYKRRLNYTFKHLAERCKIYAEEKFDFKIIEIPLN